MGGAAADPDAGLRIEALTAENFGAWNALFEACGSGCFCRYWHFPGTKNEWLERMANDAGANVREQREAVESVHASSGGLVALDGEIAVGWMKVAPRDAVPKLRRLPVYRALDLGPDDGLVSIACFLVLPSHRRRGVARALLDTAIAGATNAGARALEAYPHSRSEALRDEELWMGPLALFEACGFRSVGGNTAYPVLRLELGAEKASR